MSDQYLAQRMADLTQRLLPLLTKEDLTQTAIADISLMHRSNGASDSGRNQFKDIWNFR
tara:strand:+ start:4485 stop:4661 length:177 start_codon:yes stop_codon:yes gene_type:complete